MGIKVPLQLDLRFLQSSNVINEVASMLGMKLLGVHVVPATDSKPETEEGGRDLFVNIEEEGGVKIWRYEEVTIIVAFGRDGGVQIEKRVFRNRCLHPVYLVISADLKEKKRKINCKRTPEICLAVVTLSDKYHRLKHQKGVESKILLFSFPPSTPSVKPGGGLRCHPQHQSTNSKGQE